jgi:hypothetical protein
MTPKYEAGKLKIRPQHSNVCLLPFSSESFIIITSAGVLYGCETSVLTLREGHNTDKKCIQNFSQKHEGKKPLGRQQPKYKDIKMDHKK